MKKVFIQPSFRLIEIETETGILASSPGDTQVFSTDNVAIKDVFSSVSVDGDGNTSDGGNVSLIW